MRAAFLNFREPKTRRENRPMTTIRGTKKIEKNFVVAKAQARSKRRRPSQTGGLGSRLRHSSTI
jgi:hypothetical protein